MKLHDPISEHPTNPSSLDVVALASEYCAAVGAVAVDEIVNRTEVRPALSTLFNHSLI